MTSEMAACIRISDILLFLESSSGKECQRQPEKGSYGESSLLYWGWMQIRSIRDFPVSQEVRKKEVILVQGIIDAYFEEKDGIVVLDYKTDKVKSAEQLKERYHAQLEYYAQALEGLLEKPVKEKIIYSFTLREEIRL